MKPGAVSATSISRRFLLYPQQQVTLKEAIIRRRHLRRTEIWAIRDASFEIVPGEAVGVIGRNGSGKTTLLRLIAGIFRPTKGRLEVGGSVASLLELGAGFHPDFTGRENVYMNGAIHGLKRRYVTEKLDEIVSFAELERFIDVPVRTYSAGMYMRLGFSIAAHLDPDVLLLDEVFAVGDEAFQRKCIGKVLDLKERGRTLLFVSHSAPAVERLCERAILLNAGRVLADGPAQVAISQYQRMLAAEEDPAERGAGLREWGSGEARVVAVRLEGADGAERRQFLSGGKLVVRLRVAATQAIPPPRVALEFRDANGSLLGVNEVLAEKLGWDGSPGTIELAFSAPRLPLADGRFQLSVSLSHPDSTRQFHRLDPALEFTVFPDEDQRGWFRFEGEWSLVEAPRAMEAADDPTRGAGIGR
jgi:ABC-type polysaccharide/polyol phosphate transport system ATPase subunit